MSLNHQLYTFLIWTLVCWFSLSVSAFGVLPPSIARFRPRVRSETRLEALKHEETEKLDLITLIVDHYDSYTYNLYDMVASLCQKPPIVQTKDSIQVPHDVDAIILSPGPGRPSCPDDMGQTLELIENSPHIPILGVCLGHQALAHYYGGTVSECPTPVHGQVHTIELLHKGQDLWGNLTQINVTRYHSLAVQPELPDSLEVTAWYRDEVIMAMQHATLPHYGVQFHPESIGTSKGKEIVRNFLNLCQHRKLERNKVLLNGQKVGLNGEQVNGKNLNGESHSLSGPLHQNTHYRVSFRTLYDVNVSPTQVFEDLYGKESHAIWLDSASHEQQQRYSIMSGMTGPLSKRIEYFGKEHEDTGMYITDIHGNQEVRNVSILDYLQEELDCVHLDGVLPDLPFVGGFLGYLGYEVGQETELKMNFTTKATETKVPTAAFIFCDQALIHDHIDQTWHLILLSDAKSSEATVWLDVTEARVRQIQPRHLNGIPVHTKQIPLAWKPSRSRSTYQANIDQCHGEIRRGESYELCLTNHLETTVSEKKDPWDLYQLLRRRNPAPFAAYAKLGPSLTVCCSSPERFVSVQPNPNGELLVEAKPIKGTVARSRAGRDDQIVAALTKDVKNRAENLMIVDLLRNDLNRVCQTASVHVPRLFGVESFATVHQMVSTIRGILKQNKTAVHVLRAAFPGGSMTGAPKRRSMEILQALEEGVPRGVYSGSLGYLSVHGCMDMNIVIRTAVIADGGKVSIGAGGAITVLSEFEDEYEEMLLKARAVQDAVELWASLEDKRSQGMITEQQKATTKS